MDLPTELIRRLRPATATVPSTIFPSSSSETSAGRAEVRSAATAGAASKHSIAGGVSHGCLGTAVAPARFETYVRLPHQESYRRCIALGRRRSTRGCGDRRKGSVPRSYRSNFSFSYGFPMVFFLFSFCFLFVFLGLKFQENKKKTKRKPKKTQENQKKRKPPPLR